MKKLLAVLCLLGIIAISIPAMAEDGHNFPDQFGDLLTGKRGDHYIGVKIIKAFELKEPKFGCEEWGIESIADFQIDPMEEDHERDIRFTSRAYLKF